MPYQEFRCENCNRLLAKEDIIYGDVEIKCDRCNRMNNFHYIASIFTSELDFIEI